MFNALNRFISRLDGESPQQAAARHASLFGFQVLRNTSPDLPIEPWFDFIIGINGRPIDNPDQHLFAQEVRNCAGSAVVFTLWNAKGERSRDLHIPVSPDTASLGLALQWTPLAVAANIWHVLDVAANSPADLGGLLPYGDYILGSPDGVLHGESGLSELVEAHLGIPLRLYVYNNEYNVSRIVTIQPTRDWGGEGILGCVLGYGALHRIPPPLSEPATAPGETLFDGSGSSGVAVYVSDGTRTPVASSDGFIPVSGSPSTVFTPATAMSLPMAPPPPTSSMGAGVSTEILGGSPLPPPMGGAPLPARKKKDRAAHGNKAFMDDYFKEEEMKSREADNAPSRGATPVAPPPKAGAPPPPQAIAAESPPVPETSPAAEAQE